MTDLSHYRIDEASWREECRVAVIREGQNSGRYAQWMLEDGEEGVLCVAAEDAAAFIADTAMQAGLI